VDVGDIYPEPPLLWGSEAMTKAPADLSSFWPIDPELANWTELRELPYMYGRHYIDHIGLYSTLYTHMSAMSAMSAMPAMSVMELLYGYGELFDGNSGE